MVPSHRFPHMREAALELQDVLFRAHSPLVFITADLTRSSDGLGPSLPFAPNQSKPGGRKRGSLLIKPKMKCWSLPAPDFPERGLCSRIESCSMKPSEMHFLQPPVSLESVLTTQNKLNILLQVETPEHLHGVLGSGCELMVTLWLASDSLSVQGLLPLVIL